MIRLQAIGGAAVAFAIAACHPATPDPADQTAITGASVGRWDAAAAPDYSPSEPTPASIDTRAVPIERAPGRMTDAAAAMPAPPFRGSSFGNDPPPASTFQGTSFGNDNTAPPR
jgi:hypothetical protein